MSTKSTIIMILVTAIISIIFLTIANVDTGKAAPKAKTDEIKISVTIDYPEDVTLKDYKKSGFSVAKGSTVLEALKLFCAKKGISFKADDGKGIIVSINNLQRGDFTDNSRWAVKINGKECKKPLYDTKTKDGDKLKLIFKEN